MDVPADARDQLRGLAHLPGPLVSRELLRTGQGGRPASVLILFSPRDRSAPSALPAGIASGHRSPAASRPETTAPLRPSDLDVLLQVRSSTLREHAGQVSFPGGRREAGDVDAVHTALREAAEETGLDVRAVEVLATLPAVPLPVSDHSVTPVIGWWASPAPLLPVDRAETTRILQVPVAQLLDPATRFTGVVHRGERHFDSPAFDVDGTIVWGFTGIVLDRLFDARVDPRVGHLAQPRHRRVSEASSPQHCGSPPRAAPGKSF
jgi:8-oxo-dGTP pyrophosphatase MutT (NUDIX family)